MKKRWVHKTKKSTLTSENRAAGKLEEEKLKILENI